MLVQHPLWNCEKWDFISRKATFVHFLHKEEEKRKILFHYLLPKVITVIWELYSSDILNGIFFKSHNFRCKSKEVRRFFFQIFVIFSEYLNFMNLQMKSKANKVWVTLESNYESNKYLHKFFRDISFQLLYNQIGLIGLQFFQYWTRPFMLS